MASLQKKKLIRVLEGEAIDPPPLWLMRQAGRYLPEYRETRAEAGSFLDLCYRPDLAEEVTLQPIRRYGFDAAILFADILLVPQALGADVWFVEGEGPRLSQIKSAEDVSALKPVDAIDDTLSPIYETVARLSKSLPDDTALIGFAGAPWTVATYMVAGRGTPDQGPARQMMYQDADLFRALINRITDATIHYLKKQIEAGAEAVKIFDSWAGVLAPEAFETYAVEPVRRIVEALKAAYPSVPVIGFPRGAGVGYVDFTKKTNVDALAIDTMTSLVGLRRLVGDLLPLQGNLDPMLLVTGGHAMQDAIALRIKEMAGTPYIFNLGHGITPNVPPEHVQMLVETIRGRA